MRKRFQWTVVALAVMLVASMLAPAPAAGEFPVGKYVYGGWHTNDYGFPFYFNFQNDCIKIEEDRVCSYTFLNDCSVYEYVEHLTPTRVRWMAPKFNKAGWFSGTGGFGRVESNMAFSERQGYSSNHVILAAATDRFYVPTLHYQTVFYGVGDRPFCEPLF